MSLATYDSLCLHAIETLRSGRNIFLDATFSKREHRTKLSNLVRDAAYQVVWIETHVSAEQALERLKECETLPDVVSDARLEDFEALTNSFEEPDELSPSVRTRLSTIGDPDSNFGLLLKRLAAHGAFQEGA